MNSKNKNLLTLTRVVSALATTLLLVSFQPVPALAQQPNLTPAQEAQLRAMTPAQRQSLLNNVVSGQVGNISEPALGLASGSISIDKFIHALLFAVCGALIVKGWMEQIGRWQWVFLSLMGNAMFTEFLQLFVPGRGASVGDLLADCIRAGIGMFWAFCLFRPTSE
jgi:VanZ family protein